MTGVTGTLGSRLLEELVKDGHRVTGLVHRRPPPRLDVGWVEGDVTQPDFGLGTLLGERPVGPNLRPEALIHCAGQVRFTESRCLHRVNVYGVENAIKLAKMWGVPLFHVSTAYVVGALPFDEVDTDDPAMARELRNAYEGSKFAAECLVRHAQGLEYTIVRPSILVGDSRVVGIPPPMGLYKGVKAVAMVKRWAEQHMGLPPLKPALRLAGDPLGTLNLIPVDLAARQFADLIKANARGCYHLVNENPPTVQEVMASVSRVMDADLQVVSELEANPAERLLALLLRDLLPYLQGEAVFQNDNIHPLTQARCQGVSAEFIEATTRRFLGAKR